MGTARCVKFTCPLLNMTDLAKIYIRSRLWNSTMLEVSTTPAFTHMKHTHHRHIIMHSPCRDAKRWTINTSTFLYIYGDITISHVL